MFQAGVRGIFFCEQMLKTMDIYRKHIKGTYRKDLVPDIEMCLCNIKTSIRKKLTVDSAKVFLTARALKHIYDRIYLDANKPDDFALVIQNLHKIIGYPDKVCRNKKGRRGEFVFLKGVNTQIFLSTLEKNNQGSLYVVTGFIPKESYYKNLEEIWHF